MNSLRYLAPIFSILLTILVHIQPAVAQQRVDVPNTVVSLVPLQGYTNVRRELPFGLENVAAGGSIIIAEFPADAHPQLFKTLFSDADEAKEQFAKRGIVIDGLIQVDTPDGRIPLLSGQQEANGKTLEKWMALLKGSKTVMITVQVPEGSDLDDEAVAEMIKTVKRR